MKPDISIVVPVYNEESNLPYLFERLSQMFSQTDIAFEVVMVNDGSSDNSLKLMREFAAKDSRFKYVSFSRNFGHQPAFFAGMEHTLGAHIAFIDADLQDPPELLLEMFSRLQQGYDVVYAVRRNRQGVSVFKKIAYSTFYRLLDKISNTKIPLDTGDFRIMKRKVAEQIAAMPEREKFLRGQIAWVGFRQFPFPYDRPERHSGTPAYSFSKLLKLALDGITSFSDFPLKLATYLGFGTTLFSLLLMVYTLVSKFILNNGTPQGWASLMMTILFMGGIQLICLGIIGEYLIRIGNNVKQRPIYIVDETNTTKQLG
ncbi:MAG: glycosyltransferase family 2 protein [Chitinophagales bacterium]|nr:glycosyltransferase family 2 protein [Chitinophagales bacterium]